MKNNIKNSDCLTKESTFQGVSFHFPIKEVKNKNKQKG